MEELILKALMTQSFPVLLLAGIAYTLYRKQMKTEEQMQQRLMKLEQDVDTLNRERKGEIERLLTLAAEIKVAFEKSTQVIEINTDFIRELNEYMRLTIPAPPKRTPAKAAARKPAGVAETDKPADTIRKR